MGGLICSVVGFFSLPVGAVLTDRCERKWVYAIVVSRHDIATIWVAFFSRWQRYRGGQVMINCQGPLIYAWQW